MKSLISITDVGTHRGLPRIWLGAKRLASLGFDPGKALKVEDAGDRIRVTVGDFGNRKISSRRGVPVVDLNSKVSLRNFDIGESVKITSHFGKMIIQPTRRTFHIREAEASSKTFRVLECFAGGGTFHDALAGIDSYRVVGALEREARFLNVYHDKAEEVETLLHGDLMDYEPDDLPRHDILLAGIPCTDHSTLGRTANQNDCPESGKVGNLYMDLLPMIRWHRPRAIVIENVPSYGRSEAGRALIRTLGKWGYSVTSQILDPSNWGEVTVRKRFLLVATLNGPFQVEPPKVHPQYRLDDFLDSEDPVRDLADAKKAERSIRSLADRTEVMKAKGNGWRHRIFDRNHCGSVPTITCGYYCTRPTNWAIHTPYGPRFLRKEEIARIHGHSFPEGISKTLSAEMSGQGVMSRVFRDIFCNLAEFLQRAKAEVHDAVPFEDGDSQLELFT